MERETGLEPATLSLEGCRSSQLSYSRKFIQPKFRMGRGGFEPPKAEPTDLQSVPFGHSGTSPEFWEKRDFQKPVKHPTLSSNAGRQNPF